MNTEHLSRLIQNYLEHFDEIRSPGNPESIKWRAVQHFQTHWNIADPDFSGMFCEALKYSDHLINNHIMEPIAGIVALAALPQATEQVRSLFRALYAGGSEEAPEALQQRIAEFQAQISALMQQYLPGKWKYAQDFRTAVFYINLMYPADNFMYKATQARAFLYCIEYSEDFGSGNRFRLAGYYRMCRVLAEAIRQTPALMQRHMAWLTDDMYQDEACHIMAYDMIHSAVTFHLYDNISIIRPTKANARKLEQQEHTDVIKKRAQNRLLRLNAANRARAVFDDFSAKGLCVRHRLFGAGTVVDQEDCTIAVQFAACNKKFQLPGAFSTGFLTTEETEMMESFTEMDRLDREIAALRAEIDGYRYYLNRDKQQ